MVIFENIQTKSGIDLQTIGLLLKKTLNHPILKAKAKNDTKIKTALENITTLLTGRRAPKLTIQLRLWLKISEDQLPPFTLTYCDNLLSAKAEVNFTIKEADSCQLMIDAEDSDVSISIVDVPIELFMMYKHELGINFLMNPLH